MTTQEKRVLMGKRTLERLRLDWKSWRMPKTDFLREAVAGFRRAAPTDDLPPVSAALALDWPPSLDELLAQTSLPPMTVLLGVCEDGLPFTLDLNNPAPGATLVIGDAGSGKTHLLRQALISAARLSPAYQVAFYLVAERLDEYQELSESDHCQAALTPHDPALPKLIAELARAAEERRHTPSSGTTFLLVIDDLAACVAALDEESFTRLYWLARHGARSQVWTLAALPANRIAAVGLRFLSAFRTRLLGFCRERQVITELIGREDLPLSRLAKGREFCTPYGEEILRLWICNSEPVPPEEQGA